MSIKNQKNKKGHFVCLHTINRCYSFYPFHNFQFSYPFHFIIQLQNFYAVHKNLAVIGLRWVQKQTLA